VLAIAMLSSFPSFGNYGQLRGHKRQPLAASCFVVGPQY